jgi:carboxylate-amine ligase
VRQPHWARWADHGSFLTVGVEEEVMLLDPVSWTLAQAIDELMPRLPPALSGSVRPETHAAAAELGTGVHTSVGGAIDELRELRGEVKRILAAVELSIASAGTHPFAIWRETTLSKGERYLQVYDAMRELARREPTFALHVHVGVGDPERAITAVNRLRAHLPLLLALSANSPFWQGRDSGLASARTPVFQAFPRVGVPRRFARYSEWVEAVELLVRLEAFPEPTFLWWDVRPQPRLGTVEVRIMDAQTSLAGTAGLVALVQCVVALELDRGYSDERAATPEVLVENRFLAARDGIAAELIDPVLQRRVPVAETAQALVEACRPYARELSCEAELAGVAELVRRPADLHQIELASRPEGLPGVVAELARGFLA